MAFLFGLGPPLSGPEQCSCCLLESLSLSLLLSPCECLLPVEEEGRGMRWSRRGRDLKEEQEVKEGGGREDGWRKRREGGKEGR